ncbi:quinone oxidoreductase family protein [Kitasatospora sp. NPDC056531]|uniref:quinone oxidoreductase family protein n=1 Tax=Kitasatospora sp. NPDC056531 TaxID=3345856 RepID=UPI0036BCF69E
MSNHMQTVQVSQPGSAEELRPTRSEKPEPGPGEVLVRTAAIGVNFIDVYYRNGSYAADYPLVPGQEAAGTVEAVGEGVEGFPPGTRVAYATHLGAYAEFAVVPADKLVHVPDGVESHDAAAVLLQGLAAHYLTHDTHPIAPGETVVVLAAAGGLGRLMCQLAANRGATVIGVVSSELKAKAALEAGAHHTAGYEDFDKEVRRITDGAGAHVVYDSVGAATHLQSLRSLRRRGTLAICGLSSGAVPPLDIELLRGGGSLFLTRPTMKDHVPDTAALRENAAAVFGYLADGVIRPSIHEALPLERAADAHRLLESRTTTGKLLLVP